MVNFVVCFLRAYSRLSEICGTVKKLIDYYTSSTPSKWVFLTSSTTPIPIGTFHNSRYSLPSNIEYIFDTYRQRLVLNHGSRTHITETLPFLSGTLSVGDRTFSLDEFIDTAQFEMTRSTIPIPLMILRCWSIVNGVWFCDKNQPIFDFIDMEGNEHSFDIFSPDLDYELWDRLLLGTSESDDDSEDDRETETTPTQATTDAILPSAPLTLEQLATDSMATTETVADSAAVIADAVIADAVIADAATEDLAEPTLSSAPLPSSQPDTDTDIDADTSPSIPTMTDVPILSA